MAKKKYHVDIRVRDCKNRQVASKSMSLDIEEYKEAVRLFKIE